MAQITAAMVKQLREMTDSPMMECKKALVEADGDMDLAVDVLRKNGLAAAAKKAGRATNEGAMGAYVSDDARVGAIVEVPARPTSWVPTPSSPVLPLVLLSRLPRPTLPTLRPCLPPTWMARTVEAALTELIHVIGENMKITRFASRKPASGAVSSYIHMGGKIGVLVEFSFEKPETAATDAFKAFAHDVAMQVAATAPICAVREDVPAEVVEHEKSIYKAQAAESGKPEAIQEKMAIGRLEKFYKGCVLNEQEFIKDSSLTISQYAAQVSKEVGDTITVCGFDRLERGEDK